MAGLSRDVSRWLQSLKLSSQIENPKRDLSSGRLIGEVFSTYFPKDLRRDAFFSGTSLDKRCVNWYNLRKFFGKRNLQFSHELLEGVIHEKEGAAQRMLQVMYDMLTGRTLWYPEDLGCTRLLMSFTDRPYQQSLPYQARTTACHSIRTNIPHSEFTLYRNTAFPQRRAHMVMMWHDEDLRQRRFENPCRYNIKPRLGDLAQRRSPHPCACAGCGCSHTHQTCPHQCCQQICHTC